MPMQPLDLTAIRKEQRRIAALMGSKQDTTKVTRKYPLKHHPTKVCSKLQCYFCSTILGRTSKELLQVRAEHDLLREQRRYRRLLEQNITYDKTLYVNVGGMNLRGIDARGYGRKESYFGEEELHLNGAFRSNNDSSSPITLGNRTMTNGSFKKLWRLPNLRKFRPGNVAMQLDGFNVVGDQLLSSTTEAEVKSGFSTFSRQPSVRFDDGDEFESELDFGMSRNSTMWREQTQTAMTPREISSQFSAATTPAFALKYLKEQKISRANLLNRIQTAGGENESPTKVSKGRQVKFDLERNRSQYFVSPEYYSDDDDYGQVESDESVTEEVDKSPTKRRRKTSRNSSWCQCETPSCKSTDRCSSCNTVGYHHESCEHFDAENSPYCLVCNKRMKREADNKRRKSIAYRTYHGMKEVVVGTRRVTPPPKTPAKTPTKEQVQREMLWYNRFGIDREIPADFKLTGFLDSLDQYV